MALSHISDKEALKMKALLIRVIILFLPLFCYAANQKADIVTFGVYPVSIYDLDPANSSFNISFYAWWRTKDKNYKPESEIEIVNAQDYTYKFGSTGKVGDEYYTYVHYYAKIYHPWISKNFPFGRQFLTVKLEDFKDIKLVEFEPDRDHRYLLGIHQK